MDFVEDLPKSQGMNTILVVINQFSKYCHLMSLSYLYSTTQVAQMVLNHVIKLHGLPKSIITSRDKKIISQFCKELFNIMGVQTKYSTAYHPRIDEQSERLNQYVKMYLCCVTGVNLFQWNRWLPLAKWWYNTSFHAAIKMSPYKALYGTEALIVNYHQVLTTKVAIVEEFIKNRTEMQGILKENLCKASERMKIYVQGRMEYRALGARATLRF